MTDIMCLAIAIYFEARGEPYMGQRAVANVVINRVEDHRYPDTVCGVVFEKKAFSFTHDGKSDKMKNKKAKVKAMELSKLTLEGDLLGITSTHYHATYVSPFWAKHYKFDGKIGVHVFYTNDTKFK